MTQAPERPNRPSEWRELAEQKRKSQPPSSGCRLSRAQTDHLVEELKVHEIELEMQNDALLASRAEVEASLERYTDLYDLAPVGYFTLTANGSIRRVNLPGARLLGLERARLNGRRFRAYVSCGDRSVFDSWLKGVFAVPPSRACVVTLARQGETARAVQIEATLSADGLEARALVTDITARQALEEQLRQAHKMELVGQLAGGIAHDFNNILAAMMLNLDILERQRQLPEEAQALLHDLDTLARRASGLTGQLLLFSRRETIHTTKVELNAALTRLLQMLERTLGEDICFVRLGCAGELWVDCDVAMLEQAIMNVCLNARDAMPNGGTLTLEASAIDFELENVKNEPQSRPGAFVCLRITDTGCGMGSDVLRRLFEPFFTTKEVGKGTGLGLPSAFGVLRQHDGWLSVESGVGHGSTFRMYLPRTARAQAAPEANSSPPASRRSRRTILLVEDEPELLRASARALTQLGYTVLSACDGRAALKAWTQSRVVIDLLLTDMRMPEGISGLQLAEQLWETKPSLKVVFMSGYNTEIVLRSGGVAPAYSFLPKPFDLDTLDKAVR